MSLARKLKRHLEIGRPTQLGNPTLQTWWVVEKVVEGPESDSHFADVVGVLKQKQEDLEMPYRQTKVYVLTESPDSRKGITLSWKQQPYNLFLSPIDYAHEVFPGWD
jgi:hypothetical protein